MKRVNVFSIRLLEQVNSGNSVINLRSFTFKAGFLKIKIHFLDLFFMFYDPLHNEKTKR